MLSVALVGVMGFVWLLRPRVPPKSPVDYGKPAQVGTSERGPWHVYQEVNKEWDAEFGGMGVMFHSPDKKLLEQRQLRMRSLLPALKEVLELDYSPPQGQNTGFSYTALSVLEDLALEAARTGDLGTIKVYVTVLSHHCFEASLGHHSSRGKLSKVTQELLKSGKTADHQELLSWMNQDPLVGESQFRDVLLHTCRRMLALYKESYLSYGDSAGLRRLSKVTPQIWNKYHRWIYLVEMGRCDELLIEEGRHWENHLHRRPYQDTLLRWQERLFPLLTETYVVNTDLTPPTSLYFDARLDWESSRLLLALSLYQSKHNRFPKTLEELVEDRLLPELPMDPYFRKSLPRTSPLEYDGQQVWSVGWNGLEEKGTGDDEVIWRRSEWDGT